MKHAFNVKTYSIYGDKLDIGADETTTEMVGHQILPENFDFNNARKSNNLFLIKTHELFRKEFEEDKVIYIYRDGREATVSYYHYLRNFSSSRFDFLEIINGFPFVGSWGDHYHSWISEKKLSILILAFKKSISDPVEIIDQISMFTGLVPIKYEVPGFDKLHDVNPLFFRSGKVDSFIKELTDFEQKYFWLVNGRTMREIGCIDQIPEFQNNIEKDELIFTHIALTSRKSQKEIEKKIDFTYKLLYQKDQILKKKEDLLSEKDNDLKHKDEELRQKEIAINVLIKSFPFKLGNAILWPIKKLVSK
jgi:hypothetical protein